jgi:HK97 family phage major capsid protein
MSFSDKSKNELSYQDKEKAVLLAKMSGKSVEGTKFGRDLVEKYGGSAQPGIHLPGATPWELEVSLRMEDDIRRRLVMAPLLRQVPMQTNVMKMPLNPEAGKAQWVQNTQFASANSAGNDVKHALSEITLSAYKIATREYMAYEEEEDSLIVLLPIIRDAMVRRVARGVDAAFINGVGSGADPVKGISMFDVASAIQIDSANAVTVAKMRALRKDLGVWGLDPAEIVYVVNTETYYNLLDATEFQTMDKVGDKATFLTGQIGAIGNSPVIVSGEMPAILEAADGLSTNVAAFCFAPGNFVVGNQRGLRVDTQELVETQQRVLVASLRTGLTQLTTNNGPGVSTLRYVNGAV